MKKLQVFLLILTAPLLGANIKPIVDSAPKAYIDAARRVYIATGLDGAIDYEVFERAYNGYYKVDGRRREVMTVIDFTKPSTAERLFVIDMARSRVLARTHVSHGQGSGENYATSFSNVSGSHKSSLGFYLTGGTYQGRNGYSMLLDGLEAGINDHARECAIVVHGAAYANPSSIAPGGRLGRSFGCPALPQAVSAEVIDMIKGGSVLFIYADDNSYIANSSFIADNDIRRAAGLAY